MNNKSMGFPEFRGVAALAVLLLISGICIAPACAGDFGGIVLPDCMHVDINTANGESYYIKFDGGGLNQLHITTDPSEEYGQVTKTDEDSGTFYISGTGGRGFNDNLILMFAVKGEVPDDFKLNIKSSGYRWAPTAEVNQPPSMDDIEYVDGAVETAITKSDIVYGPQKWKPAGNNDPENYPVYYGQDMSRDEELYFVFIDLRVGNLGRNSGLSDLKDNGASEIEYSVENLNTFSTFNVYAWCNQSNQGEGISWTNRVSGSGSSGFSVIGSEDESDYSSGSSGSSDSGKSEFTGKKLSVLKTGSLNGTVLVFRTTEEAAEVAAGDSCIFTVPVEIPANATPEEAILYIYTTRPGDTRTANAPDLRFSLDDRVLEADRHYSDGMKSSTTPAADTFCIDANGRISRSGDYTLEIQNIGDSCTVYGGALVLVCASPEMPETGYWIGEGCDVVMADLLGGAPEEEAVTETGLDGDIRTQEVGSASLCVLSTIPPGFDGEGNIITFNDWDWTGELRGGESNISLAGLDVRPFLRASGNSATVGSYPEGLSGDCLENRNVILTVGYGPEETVVADMIGKAEEAPSTAALNETPEPTLTPALIVSTPEETATTPEPTTTLGADEDDEGLIGSFFRSISEMIFGKAEPIPAPVVNTTSEAVKATPTPEVAEVSETQTPEPEVTEISRTGGVYVSSRPDRATIYIDNKKTSYITPKMICGLKEGVHTVKVKLDKMKFGTEKKTVWVDRNCISDVFFDADSTASTTTVTIESARYREKSFTADGRGPVCKIPRKVETAGLNPYVTIMMDGQYLSYRIYPGSSDSTCTVKPRDYLLCGVQVDSTPVGADVFVDGFRTGLQTPCLVVNVSDGPHRVSVSKQGFLPDDEQVWITDSPYDDADESLAFTLKPYTSGSLCVTSDPAGAKIYLNGKNTGEKTPHTFEYMAIGNYEIKVTGNNAYRTEEEFLVLPERCSTCEFDLKAE